MNRNGKDKKLRYATRHNNVFDNSLIKRIDLVKKWIVQEIPCFFHCTQNWKCKKLPEYQNILRQLSDILEYKIKKKPQEAIKEVWKLSSKAIIMRSKIKSCIYVQKRLSRLGYNRWREYYPDEIQSFIKEVLGHPTPCDNIQCTKTDRCKRLSNYCNLIRELQNILKVYGNHKQSQRQILQLTTKASESYFRLRKCADIRKSNKQKQSKLFP